MRKILLASVAMLSASTGGAFAQLSPGMVESAYSGQIPNVPTSAAGANNNNNVSASAIKGPTANPTPGTFVVRLGGRVNVEAGAGWAAAWEGSGFEVGGFGSGIKKTYIVKLREFGIGTGVNANRHFGILFLASQPPAVPSYPSFRRPFSYFLPTRLARRIRFSAILSSPIFS